jgi:phosphate-selective porin OprO and OprP
LMPRAGSLAMPLILAAAGLSAQPAATPTPSPTPTPTPQGVVVVAAGPEVALALGGLLQVQYDGGDRGDARFSDGNNRFYLRRARVNVSGKFLEQFDFRVEVELSGSLANTSNLRAQLTDGFVTWRRYPFLNVWAGQFKTYFGYEQLYSDSRLLTIERSLVNDRLTLGRQLGAGMSGEFFGKRANYAVGAFNGNVSNNNFNDNGAFLYAGRLAALPWVGVARGEAATWSVGIDGYTSIDANVSPGPEFGFGSQPGQPPDLVFAGKRAGWGFDTQVHSGPFDLWAEYLKTRFRPEDGLPALEVNARGWYVQAAGFLLPARLQLVAKYETFNPNPLKADNDRDTWTFGANYYIKGHNLKLQLDYLRTTLPAPDPVQNKLLARVQASF